MGRTRSAAQAPVESIPLARLVTWGVLAATFTLLVVHYSSSRGKLMLPATYDDVTYLRDGLAKLDGFYRAGVGGLVSRISESPPHSPLATLLAFGGFAIFGTHDWSPYAANALIVYGLLILTDLLTGGLSYWQKVAVGLFVLTVPISAECIYEFRPDMAVGVLTTAAILFLLKAPLVRSTARSLLACGLIIAAALIAKPSVFPIVLGLIGVTLLAAAVRDRILLGREAGARPTLRAWSLVLLPALLIPLPWYVRNRHEIFFYITENALGHNSAIWSIAGGWREHLLYHSSGYGGAIMLGRHFFVIGALLAISCCALLWRMRKGELTRAACYAFVLAVAYIGPSVYTIKTQFVAVTFDFLAVCLTVMAIRFAITNAGWPRLRRATPLALVLLVLLGTWFAKWPLYWGEPTRADVIARNGYPVEVYRAVRARAPAARCRVMVAVMGAFVNTDALGYMADKEAVTGLDFVTDFTNSDPRAFEKMADRCEFVVIGDPDNPEDNPNAPYTRILPRTLPMMRMRGDFELAATCPAVGGKNYYVFQRRGGSTRLGGDIARCALVPNLAAGRSDLPASAGGQ